MAFLVRHKKSGGFISSGHTKTTQYDEYNLVPIANARLYPTISGAKSGALSHIYIADIDGLTRDNLEIVEAVIVAGEVVGEV